MTILGLLILLPLLRTCAALDIIAPSPQRAFVTNDTVLNCSFTVDKQPLDLNFLAVLWNFQDKVILRYDNKGFFSQDPRMSLNTESLREGDASLHISNVTLSDGGIYKCRVIYSPESKEKEVLFEVLARPQLSILSTKVQSNKESTLTCKATGFFPPDILIVWYRDGKVLRNNFLGEPQVYKEGTYQANSTVTITPTNHDRNQIFSCRVQHDSLREPLEREFQLNYEDTEESPNVVMVVVIVLVVVAIIIIGIGIYMRNRKLRKKDRKAFTLMDIEGPTKLIAGEETSLHCRAINCPENVSVTWLEKRGGKECEVPEFHGRDQEEEERLLDTQYGVLSCREGPHYTSALKFRPSVAKHKDVTFICRYSCGEQKKERTFHCRTIYGKPQLLQPVSQSLVVSGELKYLVTLEKFYPRDITLTWTRGVEEPREILISTETFTDLPDGTYSVCSEVRIPEELLKDPELKVRVSWKHQSLETPGYKDLSIRDKEYPWNPVVEEIETPHLFHNTPVILQCHISEYFPDAITVTWLRRSENEELCEETDHLVSITATPSRKEADNTYSCTSGLTITPKLSVHQGAAYICRVDHPSLERPSEGKTKKLVVKAKPQMVEPIMITLGDSSRALFTLNLQKFYPKDINIEWKYEQGGEKYEMPSSNKFTSYEDLTHDVTSVGNILMAVFNDPNFKVFVTWKHETMDEAESRTLTIRDLPWRPQVGEIIIPKLEEDKKTNLTCDISGYFPDQLTVSWFKKEPGRDSDPIITPLPKDAYKVSSKKELKDKTFSCQSSLTITPSFTKDQGAEFICKVDHPSLEHPIEKSTGPIRIDLPCPQVGEIIIPKLKEGKAVSLSCDISGYFPEYLNVSWFRKEPGTDTDPIMTRLPNEDFRTANNQRKDKTFSCRSTLTFTPSVSRDQGAEFICRVNCTNLEHPIERTTGPIHFNELSVNGTSQTQLGLFFGSLNLS